MVDVVVIQQHHNTGPIDAWRVMMALKSGLAAETAWALDILMVLSASDVAVGCLPGVLEGMCEHLRWVLVSLFPTENFQELQICAETQKRLKRKRQDGARSDDGEEEEDEEVGAKRFYLQKSEVEELSKSMKKSEGMDELAWCVKKEWDVEEGIETGCFDWMMGRGDSTNHIVPLRASPLHSSPPLQPETPTDNAASTKEADDFDLDELLDGTRHVSTTPSASSQTPLLDDQPPSSSVKPPSTTSSKRKPFDRHESLMVSLRDVNLFVDQASVPLSCSQLEAIATLSLLPPRLQRLYADEDDDNDDGDDDGVLWDGEVLGVEEGAFAEVGEEMRGVIGRAMLLSALLRNLSFVADKEVVAHCGVVMLLSRLVLFRHRHKRLDGGCRQESWQQGSWWWSVAETLREDAMVVVANVAGRMDLSTYPDEVVFPLLDGLLHWMVCPHDEPRSSGFISFRRLALEALCKLCVLDGNVDLIFAMPPFARIFSLFSTLVNLFDSRQPLVVREMSIGLISRLLPSNTALPRMLALHRPFISALLDFLEACLDGRLSTVDTSQHHHHHSHHHHHHSMHHPFSASTSTDVLNRVASTLCSLSEHPDNQVHLARQQQRLLMLATHSSTPNSVATILTHALANCP